MRLVPTSILAALATAIVLVSSLSAVGGPAGAGAHAEATGVTASPAASAAPVPATARGTIDPSLCANLSSEYLNHYSPDLPLSVAAALQAPCQVGSDQAALSFVSNASGSGARVAFSVALPSAGVGAGSAVTSLGLGLWVAGVPCSYEGASYLNVELEPPYHYSGPNTSANWTVHAPVDDLVPAASCDPQCQNDTAFVTIGGVAYCEDDIVVSGVGGPTSSGWGSFAPGDLLNVTIVGVYGSSTPVTVYLNDTTHPGASLSWTYSAGVTADDQPLTPYFDGATPSSHGWSNGLDVQAIYQNCPTAGGIAMASACNSYDAPLVGASSLPMITSALFWNATSLTYSDPFAWTATSSSTGGCVGTTVECSDFTSFGGTGTYPTWSLVGTDGQSSWGYGDSLPNEQTSWGGAASEFATTGAATLVDPSTIPSLTGSTIGNAVYLDAIAADPNGLSAVDFGAYFCFGSSTPSVANDAGLLTSSLVDSPEDGNWTGSFSTGIYTGTVEYWARAQSSSGVWSTPFYGHSAVTGTTACTFPSPAAPTFTIANLTAVGGGFALTWTDPSPAIVGYTVLVNATSGGPTTAYSVGNETHALLDVSLSPSLDYNLAIRATDAAGLNATSGLIDAGAPLAPLIAVLAGPSAPFWVGNAVAPFTASALGGTAPFTYRFSFGDGTNLSVVSPNASVSTTHNYGSYFGDAAATVSVTDGSGETAPSIPWLVQVWATPLGVPQSIAAGAYQVNISWLLAPSPGGAVSHYTIYETTNPALAPQLTGAGPDNSSSLGYEIWNTTTSYLVLSGNPGETLFADVLAWNVHGEGALPNASAPLNATLVNFAADAVLSSPPGGPAPFTDHLSDWVTNGTNDVITQATYSSGFNDSVDASIAPGVGGSWLNGSLTFTSPGIHVGVLHATDAFSDFALQLFDVYVSTGAGPTITLSPPGTAGWTGWAGSSLSLRALGSGGIGPDLFTWSFGDGDLGSGANVTHTYATAGNYTITVTAVDNTTGGISIHSQPIEIFAPPNVAIASTPGPDGALSWSFTAIVGGGSGAPAVAWSFGDGSVANGRTVTHDYGAPGTYTVNVTTTDPTGKSSSATLTLTLGGGSPGSSAGTFLGLSAGTFGAIAIALAVIVIVLLLALVYVVGRRPPPAKGTAIASWKPTEERPDEEKR